MQTGESLNIIGKFMHGDNWGKNYQEHLKLRRKSKIPLYRISKLEFLEINPLFKVFHNIISLIQNILWSYGLVWGWQLTSIHQNLNFYYFQIISLIFSAGSLLLFIFTTTFQYTFDWRNSFFGLIQNLREQSNTGHLDANQSLISLFELQNTETTSV